MEIGLPGQQLGDDGFLVGFFSFQRSHDRANNELDRTHDSQMSNFALNARSAPPANGAARHKWLETSVGGLMTREPPIDGLAVQRALTRTAAMARAQARPCASKQGMEHA
jgi:hypothetical protein